MRNRKTYVRGDLLASHRLWVGYGWTRTRFWHSWDQNHIGDFLLVQRCTFICAALQLLLLVGGSRACSSPLFLSLPAGGRRRGFGTAVIVFIDPAM